MHKLIIRSIFILWALVLGLPCLWALAPLTQNPQNLLEEPYDARQFINTYLTGQDVPGSLKPFFQNYRQLIKRVRLEGAHEHGFVDELNERLKRASTSLSSVLNIEDEDLEFIRALSKLQIDAKLQTVIAHFLADELLIMGQKLSFEQRVNRIRKIQLLNAQKQHKPFLLLKSLKSLSLEFESFRVQSNQREFYRWFSSFSKIKDSRLFSPNTLQLLNEHDVWYADPWQYICAFEDPFLKDNMLKDRPRVSLLSPKMMFSLLQRNAHTKEADWANDLKKQVLYLTEHLQNQTKPFYSELQRNEDREALSSLASLLIYIYTHYYVEDASLLYWIGLFQNHEFLFPDRFMAQLFADIQSFWQGLEFEPENMVLQTDSDNVFVKRGSLPLNMNDFLQLHYHPEEFEFLDFIQTLLKDKPQLVPADFKEAIDQSIAVRKDYLRDRLQAGSYTHLDAYLDPQNQSLLGHITRKVQTFLQQKSPKTMSLRGLKEQVLFVQVFYQMLIRDAEQKFEHIESLEYKVQQELPGLQQQVNELPEQAGLEKMQLQQVIDDFRRQAEENPQLLITYISQNFRLFVMLVGILQKQHSQLPQVSAYADIYLWFKKWALISGDDSVIGLVQQTEQAFASKHPQQAIYENLRLRRKDPQMPWTLAEGHWLVEQYRDLVKIKPYTSIEARWYRQQMGEALTFFSQSDKPYECLLGFVLETFLLEDRYNHAAINGLVQRIFDHYERYPSLPKFPEFLDLLVEQVYLDVQAGVLDADHWQSVVKQFAAWQEVRGILPDRQIALDQNLALIDQARIEAYFQRLEQILERMGKQRASRDEYGDFVQLFKGLAQLFDDGFGEEFSWKDHLAGLRLKLFEVIHNNMSQFSHEQLWIMFVESPFLVDFASDPLSLKFIERLYGQFAKDSSINTTWQSLKLFAESYKALASWKKEGFPKEQNSLMNLRIIAILSGQRLEEGFSAEALKTLWDNGQKLVWPMYRSDVQEFLDRIIVFLLHDQIRRGELEDLDSSLIEYIPSIFNRTTEPWSELLAVHVWMQRNNQEGLKALYQRYRESFAQSDLNDPLFRPVAQAAGDDALDWAISVLERHRQPDDQALIKNLYQKRRGKHPNASVSSQEMLLFFEDEQTVEDDLSRLFEIWSKGQSYTVTPNGLMMIDMSLRFAYPTLEVSQKKKMLEDIGSVLGVTEEVKKKKKKKKAGVASITVSAEIQNQWKGLAQKRLTRRQSELAYELWLADLKRLDLPALEGHYDRMQSLLREKPLGEQEAARLEQIFQQRLSPLCVQKWQKRLQELLNDPQSPSLGSMQDFLDDFQGDVTQGFRPELTDKMPPMFQEIQWSEAWVNHLDVLKSVLFLEMIAYQRLGDQHKEKSGWPERFASIFGKTEQIPWDDDPWWSFLRLYYQVHIDPTPKDQTAFKAYVDKLRESDAGKAWWDKLVAYQPGKTRLSLADDRQLIELKVFFAQRLSMNDFGAMLRAEGQYGLTMYSFLGFARALRLWANDQKDPGLKIVSWSLAGQFFEFYDFKTLEHGEVYLDILDEPNYSEGLETVYPLIRNNVHVLSKQASMKMFLRLYRSRPHAFMREDLRLRLQFYDLDDRLNDLDLEKLEATIKDALEFLAMEGVSESWKSTLNNKIAEAQQVIDDFRREDPEEQDELSDDEHSDSDDRQSMESKNVLPSATDQGLHSDEAKRSDSLFEEAMTIAESLSYLWKTKMFFKPQERLDNYNHLHFSKPLHREVIDQIASSMTFSTEQFAKTIKPDYAAHILVQALGYGRHVKYRNDYWQPTLLIMFLAEAFAQRSENSDNDFEVQLARELFKFAEKRFVHAYADIAYYRADKPYLNEQFLLDDIYVLFNYVRLLGRKQFDMPLRMDRVIQLLKAKHDQLVFGAMAEAVYINRISGLGANVNREKAPLYYDLQFLWAERSRWMGQRQDYLDQYEKMLLLTFKNPQKMEHVEQEMFYFDDLNRRKEIFQLESALALMQSA